MGNDHVVFESSGFACRHRGVKVDRAFTVEKLRELVAATKSFLAEHSGCLPPTGQHQLQSVGAVDGKDGPSNG